MSNRGRQNVASFLALDLGIDWRKGADWFESLLLDYDVCRWGAPRRLPRAPVWCVACVPGRGGSLACACCGFHFSGRHAAMLASQAGSNALLPRPLPFHAD